MPPLDDSKIDEPAGRQDLLAHIYTVAINCAELAKQSIDSMEPVDPRHYGGEAPYASIKHVTEGQKLIFGLIQNLCVVIDAVRHGKPLPPAPGNAKPAG